MISGPELAEAFAAYCAGGKLNLSEVFVWTQAEVTVFALGIQQGEKKPSMSALTHGVRRMLTLAQEAKIPRVGVPRVGTGPNGLDWTRVRKMLGEINVGQPVRLDVFEQFVRAKV